MFSKKKLWVIFNLPRIFFFNLPGVFYVFYQNCHNQWGFYRAAVFISVFLEKAGKFFYNAFI